MNCDRCGEDIEGDGCPYYDQLWCIFCARMEEHLTQHDFESLFHKMVRDCEVFEEPNNDRREPNTNSTIDDRLRRYNLACNYCRPHKGENEGRRPKHGDQKRKGKNKRRK
jgi:hypothetical protein